MGRAFRSKDGEKLYPFYPFPEHIDHMRTSKKTAGYRLVVLAKPPQRFAYPREVICLPTPTQYVISALHSKHFPRADIRHACGNIQQKKEYVKAKCQEPT